jgi:hypothetical protein
MKNKSSTNQTLQLWNFHMKTDTFAQILLIAVFALTILSLPIATAFSGSPKQLPAANVEIASADVEIEFVPDATVTPVNEEMEIIFIADAQ